MEGVEDIPGSAMTEGITWEWTSFPEYLDAVGAEPKVLDVGAQIAHGPLRAFVMGDRGAANEPATEADSLAMAALVEEALRAGALGFSTSRTPLHRSKDGELVPGTTAAADELLAIGDALVAGGARRLPVRARPCPRPGPGVAVDGGAGPPVGAHGEREPQPARPGPRGVALGARACSTRPTERGSTSSPRSPGRSIGILYCLHGSVHPLLFHPAYAEVADLPMPERLDALADPERRRRLVHEVPDDGGFFQRVVLDKVERMWPVDGPDIDYEPDASTSIAAVARHRGVTPMEVLLDQLTADEGNGMVYAPFFNYSYGDLSMTYEATLHPRTRLGLSDAGAHCGAICDGGTPTFMLTHWARDRRRGPTIPLELRRPPPDAADGRALRPPRPRAGRAGAASRPQRHRLRRALVRAAADGLRPARRRATARAASAGLRRDVRRRRADGRADDQFTGELPGRLIRGPQAP